MNDADLAITSALERLFPADARPDWDAVMSAARERVGNERSFGRSKRQRILLAFVVVLLVVAVAAPALGFQPPFLDFFGSKHASKRVVHQFALLNVGAPRGMSPHVIAGQTRLVTTYHLRNGKVFPFWIAPSRSGGFCYLLGYGGGCVARSTTTNPHSGNQNVGALDVGRLGSNVISGSVANTKITKVEVRFVHGSAVSLPILWVGPPINRGFFFYELTRLQQRQSHRPSAVAALDDHGSVLARVASMFRPPPVWFDPSKVSSRADRHVILRSGHLAIATAPAQTGGSCWWLKHQSETISSGCIPPRLQTTPMAGGQNHGEGFTSFSAQLKPSVVRVVLRFQDGARVNLLPVEGHVLYDIPKSHWPRGHRLTAATAYSNAGITLASQKFDPLQTGVYDCAKTIPIGAGQRACP